METAKPPSGDLFTSVGAALFRRAVHLLGDEAGAARTAEELFVRFVVHARGQTRDVRGRWIWIYRVVTGYCLRQLPDGARPGQGAIPDMGALRKFDEATQSIAVLAMVDGLTPNEIAEVLGLPVKLVRRRLADSVGSGDVPRHPSLFALDWDRASYADHLAGCARCRQIVEAAVQLGDRFAREIAPPAMARVAADVRTERARVKGPRWTRLLWMGGALILVASLALVVARPRAPGRAQAPYGGLKGASRAKAAGIQITVRRGEEVRALAPDARLRVGDRLHFRVRAEHPRYLELRVRGAGGDLRVFPGAGAQATLVYPGQALDRDYVVGPVSAPDGKFAQKLWIIGLFADTAFPVDRPPGPDTEVVPVRVDTE